MTTEQTTPEKLLESPAIESMIRAFIGAYCGIDPQYETKYELAMFMGYNDDTSKGLVAALSIANKEISTLTTANAQTIADFEDRLRKALEAADNAQTIAAKSHEREKKLMDENAALREEIRQWEEGARGVQGIQQNIHDKLTDPVNIAQINGDVMADNERLKQENATLVKERDAQQEVLNYCRDKAAEGAELHRDCIVGAVNALGVQKYFGKDVEISELKQERYRLRASLIPFGMIADHLSRHQQTNPSCRIWSKEGQDDQFYEVTVQHVLNAKAALEGK